MIKGIIPIMHGGLGNQMFIMASAFIVSKILKCTIFVFRNTLTNNKHNLENQDYNKSVFKDIGIVIDVDFTRIPEIDMFNEFVYHSHGMDKPFDEWNPYDVKNGTIMSAYYQYYPVFVDYEKEIREIFISGLSEHRKKVEEFVSENDIFVHIRRGDFVEFSNIHYLQPETYFSECIKKHIQIKKEQQIYDEIKLFILSDDIIWVNNNNIFNTKFKEIKDTNDNITFVYVKEFDEIQTMALMSLCKGGAICSNSTFSWWGAYLGAYEKRNPVFVPKKWISLKDDMSDLFPKEWIQV
jgi:hypothetical protein